MSNETSLDYEVRQENAPDFPNNIAYFVSSRRVLKGLNYNVITLYAVIIYAIFKLFRSAFVPDTSKIPITDARDPDDILMLCETINLYRMKQMLPQEEELYFLLIDIMRSPVMFKDLCRDSIKNKDEPVKVNKTKSQLANLNKPKKKVKKKA